MGCGALENGAGGAWESRASRGSEERSVVP